MKRRSFLAGASAALLTGCRKDQEMYISFSNQPVARGGTCGYQSGAYEQISFEGLTVVMAPPPSWVIPPYNGGGGVSGGAQLTISGTDSKTGFVYPQTDSIWNPSGGSGYHENNIQFILTNTTDMSASIGTGAVLPAGSLPGSGCTVSYLRFTLSAPFNNNNGGQSGATSQCQMMHWPTGPNNIGQFYYHRQWMRFSSNFTLGDQGDFSGFCEVSENKTPSKNYRTGFNMLSYQGKNCWQLLADGFPSGYAVTQQIIFDPVLFPVPVGQWFLLEFATRPYAGSTGFMWGAINGVLCSHVLFNVNGGAFSNGSFIGPTRPAEDGGLNRIFECSAYTNATRSSGSPITMDYARVELYSNTYPPDATSPHPT